MLGPQGDLVVGSGDDLVFGAEDLTRIQNEVLHLDWARVQTDVQGHPVTWPPTPPASPLEVAPAETMSPPWAVGPPGRAPDTGLFRAYPDVHAPSAIGVGAPFSVDVGFSLTPPPSALLPGPPITTLAGPKPEFIIQISGFGFLFPNGIQQKLVVDRTKPDEDRVTFAVQADPAEGPAPRILEISYEFRGAVVGRTWAEIHVTAGTPAQPAPAVTGNAAVIAEPADESAPHLSIDIFSEPGGSQLRWRFHCRYPDIARPTHEITTSLTEDSARSFAVQMMRQLPNAATGPKMLTTLTGAGRLIADKLPAEFWPILAQTWARARAANEEPRMQLTVKEPWIPWELAWVDADRLENGDDLLGDAAATGASIGQLWQLGRWTAPIRHLFRGDVPASPPASAIDAREMAVIVGNYETTPGVAALPQAKEEGTSLATAYSAVELSAQDHDVTALMDCTLQRDGQPFAPTVIHFAGHGQTDVNNPQFTGLTLADGSKLDPLAIAGFNLVSRQLPFVFLNACEAGVAAETLDNLGGLVGAFLVGGARAFIAPLWKVDDNLARDLAVEFYRRTFVDGESVGEAMRHLRRQFSKDSASATQLAYVFYGHPDLRLERGVV